MENDGQNNATPTPTEPTQEHLTSTPEVTQPISTPVSPQVAMPPSAVPQAASQDQSATETSPGTQIQEFSVPSIETVPLPPEPKVSFLMQNKLIAASAFAYGIVGVLFLLGMTSNSYNFVTAMGSSAFFVGLVGAALLGAGMVNIVLGTMNGETHKGGMNGTIMTGIILLVLSLIFGLLSLVPGIILIVIGSKKPAADPTKPLSPVKKYALLIGAFIGGGAAGMFITLIVTLMLNSRACSMTSSKSC